MKCTACGAKTNVMQTRTTPTFVQRKLSRILETDVSKYGIQKRRHHCTECVHRFTTYEFDGELLTLLMLKTNTGQGLRDALDVLRESLDRIEDHMPI